MKNILFLFAGFLGFILLLFGLFGLYVELEKAQKGLDVERGLLISVIFIITGIIVSWIGFKKYKNSILPQASESIQNRSRKTYKGVANKDVELKKSPRTLTPIVLPSDEKINNIFLSYRRSDSANVTGRIYDKLLLSFTKKQIFKDVVSIPLGVDFRKHLNQKVGECNVLIAVIGSQWIEPNIPKGQKRIDDDKDFVRIEIESALKRNIPVIPVLVRGAQMPIAEDLPDSLTELAFRNGIPVRPDPDFHRDMERLIQGIKHHI